MDWIPISTKRPNEKICELIDSLDGCARALKSYINSDGTFTFDMDITEMRILCIEIECDVKELDEILKSIHTEE